MSQPAHELTQLESHVRQVRKALRGAGVPQKLIANIDTRALRSGRRTTGKYRSNRDPRWRLQPDDPQYGSEIDCKLILLRLFATLLEFEGAPQVDDDVRGILEDYLGREIRPASLRDELLLEKLS